MTCALFVLFHAPGASLSAEDRARAAACVAAAPGLDEGLLLTPMELPGEHPFSRDGRGPALALQLDLASRAALDAALARDSALAPLAAPGALPSLAGAEVVCQAMARRDFPVDDPAFRNAGEPPCTFLVEYPGRAENPEQWLDHYDAHHPPIMRRFPGVRRVATYRPVQAQNALGWRNGAAMQRNKVAFDSGAALIAALASPVMDEMRADSARFPPFAPRATHHAMATHEVRPGAARS